MMDLHLAENGWQLFLKSTFFSVSQFIHSNYLAKGKSLVFDDTLRRHERLEKNTIKKRIWHSKKRF